MNTILAADEGSPVAVERPEGRSPVLLICEHASRVIPRSLGDLGLPKELLSSHIAWDPGALDLSLFLSRELDACLIHQRFSRLAYDCNRPPESDSAIPKRSEIFDIPGNIAAGAEEAQARVDAIYRPFQAAVAQEIARRKAAGQPTALVTIHSFTPVFKGVPREVKIGILHDSDTRFADSILSTLDSGSGFVVRRNDPYGPEDGVTHTLIEHGVRNGLQNVMVEVRNDLLANETSRTRVEQDLLRAIVQSLNSEETA
ncbi:N-formylglutamate amidohydrolase [Aminobacter aminovorans]|uniref:N-formylglutamate amidohydrolase n=1 Tax=Aminobacter aminovorans TaxID=83263 RepID=A0AAC8YVM1_AMIAI|nr:N-formylglutamate amidohydrolase [Aminobacter aminovorans]AMS45326.1 N-formylglutamate amidohydrolase [Aminobacter aminovorans]MBB3708929.1 putative N-formylglutamate amidohydrolase [Aminobacter aminovorans]